MRILQVVTLLSPDGAYGGPARVALNSSAELIRRGHDVTVAAATRGYQNPPTEVGGVPVKLFDARSLLPTGRFSGTSAPGLARWFRANGANYDLVHIHFARDLVVLPIAMSARRRRIPYVLQTHGMVTPSDHFLRAPLDAAWTRRALRDAGAICYLTAQEKHQLIAVAGTRLRLVELGNGVPDYPCAPAYPDPPEVLFAARLHSRKRPLAFIEMARMLLDSGVDARFTLLGSDEGEGPAVKAASVGERRINWEGAVAPDRVPQRMAAARVYVLPSIREPYPMTVLEAMSVGVPVVIADDCGLAATVDRTGCGIVTDSTATSLAAAVAKILGDNGLAAEMGRRGRAAARTEFGMPAICERLEETYARVKQGSQR